MELDHIFVMVEPGGGAARERLERAGWTETYRRAHPGQGTTNICYALENAFLELLWITDAQEARGDLIRRTGLYERSCWRENNANPFGLAWRAPSPADPIATWPYAPPYLPEGMHIPVAVDSDDLAQPFLFQSPGRQPPSAWPAARRGVLQGPTGLRRIQQVLLYQDEPCAALRRLGSEPWLELRPGLGSPAMDLILEGPARRCRLRLPGFQMEEISPAPAG